MSTPDRDATFLVVGSKPWNRRIFDRELQRQPGRWHFLSQPSELRAELVAGLGPRYVFFLHWSWKVPEEILARAECVCFHMTDLPYGRGGSPLQNLIARGVRRTQLTALRMTGELDAGPIYLQEDLSLEGGAEEIYIRATGLAAQMIERIVRQRPEPRPQTGRATVFKRRRPEESEIPRSVSLQQLFDFLRMLDAEGYPRAFLEHRDFRYEFHRPALYDGRIVASVTITPREEDR